MNRIYFRLNWRDYFKISDSQLKKIKKETLIDLYQRIYKEIKSSVSKNQSEQLIALDDSTRTVIAVPKKDYTEVLNECLKYLVAAEDYESCAEIRDTLIKIETKKPKRKPKEAEKLLLIKTK
jgi:protein-arginine kinase activator protein McsA